MLLEKESSAPGPYLALVTRRFINRTGTSLAPGSLVSLNLGNTSGAFDTQSGQAQVGLNMSDFADNGNAAAGNPTTGYIYGAACAPTTLNIRHVMAIVDPAGPTIPDNTEFNGICQGHLVKCLIEPSSGATAGEWLIGTNGQYYATGQTDAELGSTAAANATDIVKVIGQLMEAGPTGGSAALKTVTFWGGIPFAGLVCKGGAT